MEDGFLNQWACLLEPPGEACGESQWTPVRSSVFTVDDQPQAPETHTPRACIFVGSCLFPPKPARRATAIDGGHPRGRRAQSVHD